MIDDIVCAGVKDIFESVPIANITIKKTSMGVEIRFATGRKIIHHGNLMALGQIAITTCDPINPAPPVTRIFIEPLLNFP
jgi:hypothetical protein